MQSDPLFYTYAPEARSIRDDKLPMDQLRDTKLDGRSKKEPS